MLAATAPKKCARGRSEDLLLALLTFTSSARLPEAKLEELLQSVQREYFNFSGSVTAGLRLAAEACNTKLMEHNLHAPQSEHLTAALNLAVVKRDQVFLAHAGAAHTFVLGQEKTEDLWDEFGNGGRGLGLSRAVNVRYFTAQVQNGDALVLCAKPPQSWTVKALTGGTQLTLESLRRRLLNQAGPNLMAVVVRFQTGKGQLHRLRVRSGTPAGEKVASTPRPQPEQESTAPTPRSTVAVESIPLPAVEELLTPKPVVLEPAPVKEAQEPPPEEEEGAPSEPTTVADRRPIPPAPRQPVALRPRQIPVQKPGFTQRLAAFFMGAQAGRQRLSAGVRTVTGRVLPGRSNQPPVLSPAMMLFIAIAVPLVVVAIAVTVYTRNGLSERHQLYLSQAKQAADRATAQVDPALKRNEYQTALEQLQKAEEYGTTDQSTALRSQVQDALDRLDGVRRLTLYPALKPGMSQTAKITRLVASDEDVYLLDATQNQILRLKLSGDDYRYELDRDFICPISPTTMVDLVLIPFDTKMKATIMGIDAVGNLIYCSLTEKPAMSVLEKDPRDLKWERITAMEQHQKTLVVLDAGGESPMVWRYIRMEDGFWGDAKPFFTRDVPRLDDVIDMTLYANQLYLLHGDGKMTLCEYDTFGGTDATCQESLTFEDLSSESAFRLFDFPLANFIQLTSVDQPSPAIFILDEKGPTVLMFGLKMKTLYWQLRPRASLEYTQPDKPLTAFTISGGLPRHILLMYTNQLYYGVLEN